MSDPDFYPNDFPALQGSSAITTTDGRIALLQTEVLAGAIDQATNRRILGQQTIQNQGSLAIHDRVPFTAVGKGVSNVLFLGTAGYFLGGQDTVPGTPPRRATSLHRTSFLSEYFERIGAGMAIGREFHGTAGNGVVAYSAGGWTPTLNNSTLAIEKLDQRTSVTSLIGAISSQGRFWSTAYGTKDHGYYLGGLRYIGRIPSLNIDKLQYATEVRTVIGATLGHIFYPARTSAGDASRMVIFERQKIYSLSFPGEALTLTASTGLSVDGLLGACAGNATHIWHNGNTPNAGTALPPLNRFALADNSLTALGVNFPLRSAHKAAMGSSLFGYWNVGRIIPIATYALASDLVDKIPSFVPGTETVVPLGSHLTRTKGQCEGTAISDYAASYA